MLLRLCSHVVTQHPSETFHDGLLLTAVIHWVYWVYWALLGQQYWWGLIRRRAFFIPQWRMCNDAPVETTTWSRRFRSLDPPPPLLSSIQQECQESWQSLITFQRFAVTFNPLMCSFSIIQLFHSHRNKDVSFFDSIFSPALAWTSGGLSDERRHSNASGHGDNHLQLAEVHWVNEMVKGDRDQAARSSAEPSNRGTVMSLKWVQKTEPRFQTSQLTPNERCTTASVMLTSGCQNDFSFCDFNSCLIPNNNLKLQSLDFHKGEVKWLNIKKKSSDDKTKHVFEGFYTLMSHLSHCSHWIIAMRCFSTK